MQIIRKLKGLSNPADKAGMARFGINAEKALGIRIPVLRKMAVITAKRIQHDAVGASRSLPAIAYDNPNSSSPPLMGGDGSEATKRGV